MNRAGLVFLMLALAAPAAIAERLALATWNLEWMMTPGTFDRLAAECYGPGRRIGGSERAIPCDIVPAKRWGAEDLARLRTFAAGLPLDVIALQETDGPEAAAQVLPDRAFCFTRRRHVQNVGFAIKRGIPFRCNPDYYQLGLESNDVRWGADVTLFPGTPREIRLLAVHLKSGCNRDPLSDRRTECHTLQQQVPILEDWIDRRARSRTPFAVIGDFNRRFDRDRDAARDGKGEIVAMWPELDDGEPAESDLLDAGADHGVIGCNNGQNVRMPIDHLVFSRRFGRRVVPGSFRAWNYPTVARWPDHCLISVELELESRNGI